VNVAPGVWKAAIVTGGKLNVVVPAIRLGEVIGFPGPPLRLSELKIEGLLSES
jgi:hypothetical protein